MAQAEPMESESLVGFNELQVEEVIAKGSLDFEEWTTLISETEKTYPEHIQKICLVYDSFLSEFPLCHGYWRKYAGHKTRLCTIDEVVEIFERAVQSVPYSVDVWVDFCTFSMLAFEDPCDIRRLFQRGISFVGKDYLCHSLWDKYIQFEFSQQQWSSLANIYIQALRFPTKKFHHYYDRFKKLVAFLEKETGCNSVSAVEESEAKPVLDNKVPLCLKNEEIASIIKDLLDPSAGFARSKALQKYLSVGDSLYKEACQLDENICHFEANIRRSYFHVKPLDLSQLENWHHYLDFVEKQGDFDWAVKLYERCLIPCASYPEFWMRYTKFMESKGGREIANHAMDRSTQIFLKRVPAIHLFNSRFKELIGDAFGARTALLQCEAEPDSNFVENAKMKANMEKRLGNFEAASNVYKEALEMASTKKMVDTLPILYVHFSRLTYTGTGSADAARDILIDGIKHVPQCKLLLQELIKFSMMHEGSKHMNVVDAVIAGAISPESGGSPGMDAEDLEDISSLYLEYVDLCGTIHDLMRAWNRHITVFPHSLRAASSKQPAKDAKAFELAKEVRGETFVANSHQPSGDTSSNLSIELPLQDKKISPSENPDTPSDHNLTNISEERLPSLENKGNEFESTTIDQLQSEEADNSISKRSEQESPNGSGKPRGDTPTPSVQLAHGEKPSSDVPQRLKRDSPEPSLSSLDLVQVRELSPEVSKQPREGTYRENTSYVDRIDRVTHGNESVKASQEYLTEYDVQQQHDYESEHDMKPPSLENLSLNTKIDVSSDSIPSTSDRCEDSEEVSISNVSMRRSYNASSDASLYGSLGTQASARTENEVVNSSSPVRHQNITSPQPLRQRQFPADRGGNWRQENNSDRFRRNSRFGFRGQHSQKRPHQNRRESPQRYLRNEMDAQRPQGYSSQPQPSLNTQVEQSSEAQNQYQAAAAQSNLISHQAWAIQNAQQQSLAIGSEPQQPVSPASSQASQYPMHSSGQYGNVQNNQYNQMWQYYYYQQQQFLLQQQVQLQQQQQQQLQLQQQQPQQQLQLQQQQPEHQLIQQQYQPQLQQNYQQQQPPFQQQQLQQLQQQLQYNQQQQFQLQQQFQQQQQQYMLYFQQQQQSLQYQQQPLQQQQQQQQQPPLQEQHQQQQPLPRQELETERTPAP